MTARTRRRSRPKLARAADPAPASAAAVDLDPAQPYAVDGWLQLRREDVRRAQHIFGRHPELRVAAVGGLRSRVTIRPSMMLMNGQAWDRVHAALISCAALATAGRIRVSCDTWDAFIHATDSRRTMRPQRATG